MTCPLPQPHHQGRALLVSAAVTGRWRQRAVGQLAPDVSWGTAWATIGIQAVPSATLSPGPVCPWHAAVPSISSTQPCPCCCHCPAPVFSLPTKRARGGMVGVPRCAAVLLMVEETRANELPREDRECHPPPSPPSVLLI